VEKKDFKGKCIKRSLSKSETVVKTFDAIQTAYADLLEADKDIKRIESNVLITGVENDSYTTDFLCQKVNGDYCVRECVYRKKLLLPRTCKHLDVSRNYWMRKGIKDWAIVVEKEEKNSFI